MPSVIIAVSNYWQVHENEWEPGVVGRGGRVADREPVAGRGRDPLAGRSGRGDDDCAVPGAGRARLAGAAAAGGPGRGAGRAPADGGADVRPTGPQGPDPAAPGARRPAGGAGVGDARG